MKTTEGCDLEMAALYELFGTLRRALSASVRRDLAFQVVLHPAAQKRLTTAAMRIQYRLVRGPADFDELVQVARLRLVRSLSAESLPFRDLGMRRFACWYWTLCLNAAIQALQKCNRSARLVSLENLEEQDLPLAREPSPAQRQWEDVLLAISQIRHPTVKAVMADMAAGIKIGESAAAHQITAGTVTKMRQRGVELVRGRCQRETVGQE